MVNKNIILLIFSLALFTSCSSNTTSTGSENEGNNEPEKTVKTSGTLQVETTIEGASSDKNEYIISVGEDSKPVESDGSVTFEDLDEGPYSVSIDGLSAQCSVNGNNPVDVDITAGELTTLTFSIVCEEVDPINNKIVFASNRKNSNYSTQFHLYRMNPDGSEVSLISESQGHSPDLSSDGRKLTFINGFDIYVMNVDGTGKQKLTNYDPESVSGRNLQPVWSPDGKQIAFQRDDDIFIIDANGENETRLTDTGNNRNPAWSPDGSTIAFGSYRNNPMEIFTIQPDGENEKRITVSSEVNHQYPSWSPSGDQIAYINGGEVFVMDKDGNNNAQVTTNNSGEENISVSWSPDGEYLVFGKNTQLFQVGNLYEIFTIKTDGTELTRLTNNEDTPLRRDEEPVWAPNS